MTPPKGRAWKGAGPGRTWHLLNGRREPSWGGVLSYGSRNAGSAKGGETEVLGPSRKLKKPHLEHLCLYGAEEWTCLPSSWWWLPERFHLFMLGPRPLVPGSFEVKVMVETEVLPCLDTLVVPGWHLPPLCVKGKLRPRVSLRVTERCSRVWTRIQSSVPSLAPLHPFPRQHFATSQGAGF